MYEGLQSNITGFDATHAVETALETVAEIADRQAELGTMLAGLSDEQRVAFSAALGSVHAEDDSAASEYTGVAEDLYADLLNRVAQADGRRSGGVVDTYYREYHTGLGWNRERED